MRFADGYAFGALADAGGVRFTAWSDKAAEVRVVLYERPAHPTREVALSRVPGSDVFSGFVAGLGPGALYDFRLDAALAVDPYARELPFGVHGPARVTAPLPALSHPRQRVSLDGNDVFYELHVGAFTPEGTFVSAVQQLGALRDLGVTAIELMPVAAFAGQRGWGYDGVALFAPFAPYGTPRELLAFVDAAHAEGLSVVLDVVYNHLGPDGNVLPTYSDAYFDAERRNPWGASPALEKPAFRRLVLDNARQWLHEFGFDGLRLDATHELEPGGTPHILRELSNVAQSCRPPAVLIAEDSRNDPQLLLEHGVQAVWSDDFHHAAHVLLTDEREGYYAAFAGDLTELARVIERGQLFEGQQLPGLGGQPRGRPTLGVPAARFLFALQNHDQVGNRAHGERLHTLTESAAFDAASLMLLFLPQTPLLFMGQEWASSSPFLFFSDHAGELGKAVTAGRRREFGHFSAFQADEDAIPDPQDEASFLRSKLNWAERSLPAHAATLALYRRALQLRRTDAVLREPTQNSAGVVDDVMWVIRGNRHGQRLLLFNPGVARAVPDFAGQGWHQARLLLATHELSLEPHALHLPAASAALFSLNDRPEEQAE